MTPDGFVISGVNGPANGQDDVLSSADLTQPISSWPVLATEPFDADGNFSFTDPVTPDVLQNFYVIRVDTNAPAATPPVITQQPQDTTNLLGNTASFTVGATGDCAAVLPVVFQFEHAADWRHQRNPDAQQHPVQRRRRLLGDCVQ